MSFVCELGELEAYVTKNDLEQSFISHSTVANRL